MCLNLCQLSRFGQVWPVAGSLWRHGDAMAQVFISYTKADSEAAGALASDLKAKGYDVWWDTELYAGQRYPAKIVEELHKAEAVIAIWSDASVNGDWVRSEAEIARAQKKLLTVRVPGFDASKIMPPFIVYHAEDITKREHVYGVLARLVSRSDQARTALAGDELLPVLHMFDNDELGDLVRFLDTPLINKSWMHIQWGKRIEGSDAVRKLWPDHQQYVGLIEHELRRAGGYDVANLARGEGPSYREVVIDVCGQCKVKLPNGLSVPEMERLLIAKLFEDARAKMSAREWEEVAGNLNDEMKKRGFGTPVDPSLSVPTATALGALGVQASGFLAYQYSVVVANIIAQQLFGHGLSLAANAALTRSIAIAAGPIGWIITGIMTAITLGGPAYRVTMPAVAFIANRRLERLGRQHAAD